MRETRHDFAEQFNCFERVMTHGELAEGAEQSSQTEQVVCGVPAVVGVRMRINDDDGDAARQLHWRSRELGELFAGYGAIEGAAQSEIVGQSPIEQMDKAA